MRAEKKPKSIVEPAINFLFGALILLLGMRFILLILGADNSSPIVRSIYSAANTVLRPLNFLSVFVPPYTLQEQFTVELLPIIGILLYTTLNLFIIYIKRILQKKFSEANR
jgi:hypothetical protein